MKRALIMVCIVSLCLNIGLALHGESSDASPPPHPAASASRQPTTGTTMGYHGIQEDIKKRMTGLLGGSVDPAVLKAWQEVTSREVRVDIMTPDEQEAYLKCGGLLARWRIQRATTKDVNEFFKRHTENLEVSLKFVRRSVPIGEQPRIAIVVKNTGLSPQIVLPFEMTRFTQDTTGNSRDVFLCNESKTLKDGYLHIIQPGGEAVFPASLPLMPTGTYSAYMEAYIWGTVKDDGDVQAWITEKKVGESFKYEVAIEPSR